MRAAERPDALTSALDERPRSPTPRTSALSRRCGTGSRRPGCGSRSWGKPSGARARWLTPCWAGKSCPRGVTPLTAVPTTVTFGTDEGLDVAFADGRTARCPLSALEALGTERGNPGNSRGVSAITVRLNAPILAPGRGDRRDAGDRLGARAQHRHGRPRAADHGRGDFRADRRPTGLGQRARSARPCPRAVGDHVRGAEQGGLRRRGRAGRSGRVHRAGGPAGHRPAGPGLPGTGPGRAHRGRRWGFGGFAADFAAYLGPGRTADLRRSAAAQLRRIAAAGVDEVALDRRAAQMRSSDAARRVQRSRPG